MSVGRFAGKLKLLVQLAFVILAEDAGATEKARYFKTVIDPKHLADLILGKRSGTVSLDRDRFQHVLRKITPLSRQRFGHILWQVDLGISRRGCENTRRVCFKKPK